MLRPGTPCPDCGNKEKPHLGGQLVRANPDTGVVGWLPTDQETGKASKLWCNSCRREFEAKPSSTDS